MEKSGLPNYKKYSEPGRFPQWLRPGRQGRRFFFIGGTITVIFIALTAFIAVLPGVPPFKKSMLSFADRQFSSLLSCKVSIGAISIDIRKGLVAKNIVLSDPQRKGAPINIERIAARIDVSALLRGRVEFSTITISGLSGELLMAHRGLFAGPIDIAGMTEPAPENRKKSVARSKPFAQMISAERCTVSYYDSVTNLTASEFITSVRLGFIRDDSISFDMQAGAGHFTSPVWSGSVGSADIQGAVGPGSLLFSNAEVRGDSVALTLSGTIPFSMEKAWDLTAKAEAFVAGFSTTLINSVPLKPVGRLTAQGVMTGTIAHPAGHATITGYGLQGESVASDSLVLQAYYSNNSLQGKGRLWSPLLIAETSVQAEVNYLFLSPSVGRYTATASAKNIDIRNFISAAPQWLRRQAFLADANLYVAGAGLRRLPDTMSADVRAITGPPPAGPITATIRLAGNRWRLTSAMKPDFMLQGNGQYSAHGDIEGSFHVQADTISRIASIFSKEDVGGSIIADAFLNGTFRKPVISAMVQSTQVTWRDILVSRLWGRFTLHDKKLFIDSSYIRANGPIAGALRGLVPGEFTGNAGIQAGASGRLDSLGIDGDIHIGQCSFNRYFADTVSTHFGYDGQILRWQSLLVKRGASAMLSDGMVSRAGRTGALNAQCSYMLDNNKAGMLSTTARFAKDSVKASLTLKNFNPAFVSPWFPKTQQFKGSLDANGTLVGSYENPEIRLLFSFDRAGSGGPVLSAAGDLAFSDNQATATMKFAQKGVGIPLIVTAHIPVALRDISQGVAAVHDGANVTIHGDSIAYGALINLFAPWVQSAGTISLHGTLSKNTGDWGVSCSTHIVNNELTVTREKIKAGRAVIDLRIAGPIERPAAHFTVSGDSITYQGNFITAYEGIGSIVNDVLKLDTLHISAHGGRADLSGQIPVTLKNGFSFNKNGRFSALLTNMPFGTIQPFLPDPVVITKGGISGRVIVEGTATGFVLATGTISLRDGECFLYDCDRPLGPLSADIDFKNDSMILRGLQADWHGGRIAGGGWATLNQKGVSAAHGFLKLSDVRLGGCSENLDLGIQTADIDLTKDSLISIKVNALLGDTRFTQDFSLIDIGERMKRKAPAQRPPNPLFHNVVMRVAVNCNGNLTFDSNLGKMLIDGTVTLTGRPDKPVIAARFQLLNGFVYYLDRKFTITQGTIRQYDPQRINPSFDVTATSTVSWYPPQGGKEDYDITLLVKGDLSDPLITLSALPSLPPPQIVSLLTLGTIQTGLGTDLGSRTGSMVGSQIAGLGTRKLARLIKVESVDLYGNVFGPDSAGPQLAVTKQVSSRVSVTYTTGLSRLSQQMIQVSYRLLPFLYLEAETDQQAKGGMDMKFRYSR